jgi:hypothetical protein
LSKELKNLSAFGKKEKKTSHPFLVGLIVRQLQKLSSFG